VGPTAGQWINEQTKLEILTVIESSQQQGVSARRSCSILTIEQRRVVRWQQQARQGQSLANRTPGPREALHRVLPEEIEQIVVMATSQEHVDLSHRILAVTAWDQGLFQASFSTVYRILKEQNLMSARGPGRVHNGHSKAPVRKELTGPNQRWCWDISYLMTFQKGVYLYLYLLLDEWSRKAIQWRVSWQQTAQESRHLLEGGLMAQNILGLAEDHRPEVINDRGRQMKAKPIQRLCEDHGLPQLFARPRTPNDNPFIESAFSTVKRAPEYPERFLDDRQAREYFSRYFTWYDTEHYHSAIDYVTPDQAHQGLRQQIVDQRRINKLAQRRRRREENQKQKSGSKNKNQTITMPTAPRSVINPLRRSLFQKRAAMNAWNPHSFRLN
jgi:transposase InsO family protein